jgi:hypothetical protein
MDHRQIVAYPHVRHAAPERGLRPGDVAWLAEPGGLLGHKQGLAGACLLPSPQHLAVTAGG